MAKRAQIKDLLSFDVDSKDQTDPAESAQTDMDKLEKMKSQQRQGIQKEKEIYDKKVSEIERRKEIMKSQRAVRGAGADDMLPPAVGTNLDELESKYGYKWVLINKAHRFLNIRRDRPAFRILGFFRDDESIMEYVHNLKRMKYLEMMGDIHKLPMMKYTVIAKNKERERDAEYIMRKVEIVKNHHFEHDRKADAEFQENLCKGKTGEMGKSLHKQKQAAQNATQNATQKTTKKKTSSRTKALEYADKKDLTMMEKMERSVASVPRLAELRNQRYAVVVTLQDFSKEVLKGHDDPEPLVMFVDAFENEDEARKYMDEVLQDYIVNVHMDVVDMYEWLFPEDINPDQITEHYRHEELNRIMQERKNQKRELTKFEKKMARDKKTVPETVVTDLQPKTEKITRDQDKAFDLEYEERSKENRLVVGDGEKDEDAAESSASGKDSEKISGGDDR